MGGSTDFSMHVSSSLLALAGARLHKFAPCSGLYEVLDGGGVCVWWSPSAFICTLLEVFCVCRCLHCVRIGQVTRACVFWGVSSRGICCSTYGIGPDLLPLVVVLVCGISASVDNSLSDSTTRWAAPPRQQVQQSIGNSRSAGGLRFAFGLLPVATCGLIASRDVFPADEPTSKNDAIHEWERPHSSGMSTPTASPGRFRCWRNVSDDPDSRFQPVWPHRCHI